MTAIPPRLRSTVLRITVALLTLPFAHACAQPPQVAGEKKTTPASTQAEPFSQDVPGTTVTLDMVPVTLPGASGPTWISRTEVPWDVFDVFVYGLDQAVAGDADAITRPSKPYVAMDRGFGHAGYPAISMSYHGAESFCAWLSAHTGRRYRLPTEVEWTALCNASGIDPTAPDEHAWYEANADRKTQQVGTKAADAQGLHDLYGNASEWCAGRDGTPVTMGGTFRDPAERLGCAARVAPVPAWNASDPQFPKSIWWLADAGFVGFRVVCEE